MRPRPLFLLSLLIIMAVITAFNAVAQTTTPMAFTDRDTDTPTQKLGDLWRGVSAQVELSYHVKFARLTGDDELEDGELKITLPDGTEARVWVGLGNDNVILVVEKNGQELGSRVLETQSCGILGCNEAKGTVTVTVSVDCNGYVYIATPAGRWSIGYISETGLASLTGDNDAVVVDTDDQGCAAPPPGADKPQEQLPTGPSKWLYLGVAAGLGFAVAGALLAFKR